MWYGSPTPKLAHCILEFPSVAHIQADMEYPLSLAVEMLSPRAVRFSGLNQLEREGVQFVFRDLAVRALDLVAVSEVDDVAGKDGLGACLRKLENP